MGYLRERKDGIVGYTIGDLQGLNKVIETVLPYLFLKREQILLLREILDKRRRINNAHDFVDLAEMIDKFEDLNYSGKRIIKSYMVKKHLRKKGIL